MKILKRISEALLSMFGSRTRRLDRLDAQAQQDAIGYQQRSGL